MRYIELIGPQGAGKTTMLHNLLKYRAGREWVIFEEAVIEIAGSVPWRRLNGMQSKALWLLKKKVIFTEESWELQPSFLKH
jgi:ABC-type branched-subunit amino acid transport system ATPase component